MMLLCYHGMVPLQHLCDIGATDCHNEITGYYLVHTYAHLGPYYHKKHLRGGNCNMRAMILPVALIGY